MTPKDLRNYKNLNRVIALMKKRVVELSDNTVKDTVRGSNKYYPYEERSFTVTGADDVLTYEKRLREAEQVLEYYEEIKRQIDSCRDLIEDPTEKLIFEYTLQGKTQQLTADFTGVTQSTVSLKLRNICKLIDNLTK